MHSFGAVFFSFLIYSLVNLGGYTSYVHHVSPSPALCLSYPQGYPQVIHSISTGYTQVIHRFIQGLSTGYSGVVHKVTHKLSTG